MEYYTSENIVKLTGATLHGRSAASPISYLLIDSRKLVFPSATLFFAIATSTGNGHFYLEDLYKRGVRSFVVSVVPDLDSYPDACFYKVENVVHAMQLLAMNHRMKFHFPVVGITGSNGKTIVKEWLNHLLHKQFQIIRSPRSYNSQLGVPLSIWGMSPEHELGIFEAGVSTVGEMVALEEIIQPTVGIITNIGEAHSDGFSSIKEKLQQKLQLFKRASILIYCKDHLLIDEVVGEMIKSGSGPTCFTWSRGNKEADIFISHLEQQHKRTIIDVLYKGQALQFAIPFIDEAAIENAMHCFAVAVYMGIELEIIDQMQSLPPLSMRLEMVDGQLGSRIINDSYNADLSGLLSALDFMGLQNPASPRTVILSDVSGIRKDEAKVYAHIASYLHSKQIKKLYGVGEHITKYGHLFLAEGIDVYFFRDTEELIRNLQVSMFKDQLILVKGIRDYQFERVGALLENKKHRTRLEVDLAAIAHNLNLYKKSLNPNTKMMVMVKAFSYGAGSFEIANLLQYSHVDYIAVAYTDEGVELRRAGIRMPIMIMNTEEESFSSLVAYNLEPELYSIEIASSFAQFLSKEGVSHYPVHIKLDTGMHRLGFEEESLSVFLNILNTQTPFHIKSVFTHLVASEDPGQDHFTKKQLSLFAAMCKKLEKELGYSYLKHAANTSAILRHSEAELDMVRLGIGLYGVDPGKTTSALIEAVALKTTIAQIRKVRAGESVGYGGKAIVSRDSIIATIRIGYADGFPRALGNGKGSVRVKGVLVSTVGSVCMDMTMIDITDHPEIGLQDEVLVFGQERPIVQIAKDADTIPYVLMTGVTQRVPRVYLG